MVWKTMLLGIDFGTCNSSAALMLNGTIKLVKEPLKQGYSFPSSVYLTEKGEILVGQAAENSRLRDARRYRRGFKRALGENQPYLVGELSLTVQDLVTEVLKKLKSEAEKTVSGVITDAVITVPASYKQSKRDLMRQAAQAAGFSQISLLDEPVAAATYYTQQNQNLLKDGDIILVYDFGGGTFDASLIKKQGASYQILSTPIGLENCGGTNFDQLIYEDIKNRCSAGFRQQLEPKEALAARGIVSQFCIDIKHQLSEAQEATIHIPLALGQVESYQLHRVAFNQMITPFIDRTIKACEQLILGAGLGWKDINQVLMVGGSCRIPYVQEALKRKLGHSPLLADEPELAVCQGAAIYGTSFNQNKDDLNELQNLQENLAEIKKLIDENREYLPEQRKPTIIISGKIGSGKTTTINTLFGQEVGQVGYFSRGTNTDEVYEWESAGENINIIDLPGLGDSDEKDEEFRTMYRRRVKEADAFIVVVCPPRPAEIGTIKTVQVLLECGIPNDKIIFGYNKLSHIRYPGNNGKVFQVEIKGLLGPTNDHHRKAIADAKKAFLQDILEGIRKKFPNTSFSNEQIVEYDSISGWNLHQMFMRVIKILPFETCVKLETVLSSAEKQALERETRELKEEKEKLKKLRNELEKEREDSESVTEEIRTKKRELDNREKQIKEREDEGKEFGRKGGEIRLGMFDKVLNGIGDTVGKVREEVRRKVQELRKGLEDTGKAIQQGAQKVQQGVQKGWKTFTSWFS